MTTIVAQPFNVIKWQLKFNPVAQGLRQCEVLPFVYLQEHLPFFRMHSILGIWYLVVHHIKGLTVVNNLCFFPYKLTNKDTVCMETSQ